MMNKFNINHNIILYPNEKGWKKITELTRKEYSLSDLQALDWIELRKTEDNGFKDQLWIIIELYHSMFFNGQNYFKHSFIDLIEK